jgi:uncharacterized protein Veg
MKNAIIPVTVTILSLMILWQLYLSAGYYKEIRINKRSVDSLITTNSQINIRIDSIGERNKTLHNELDRYRISLFILKIVDSSSAQSFDSVYYSDAVTNRMTIK